MYHETKMINGSLIWRNTPRGEWEPCTTVQLNAYIGELKQQLGLTRIELSHKESLLESCEKALSREQGL
jgi:hypothetical protein